MEGDKNCLISIEMSDEDVIHVFTHSEWFNEVWENSYDSDNRNAMYLIEPLYDPMDPRLIKHPEMFKYILCVFDMDALIKYPYIKRAIEHDEIKKSWNKPEEEKVDETN